MVRHRSRCPDPRATDGKIAEGEASTVKTPPSLFQCALAGRLDLAGGSSRVRAFLSVGICGGYTTFSTFSLAAFYLMERGETVAAGAYMVGSVVLSVGALIGAMLLVRALEAP
jgi:fluoride ion exporter CrcB/FEX